MPSPVWKFLSRIFYCIIMVHLIPYSEGHLKLRKCCPQHQQLFLDHFDHMECIDLTHNPFETTHELDETKDVNISSNTVWWVSDNLNFIETLLGNNEINILEDMELTPRDFAFDQHIPCFKQDPEVLLIQSNMFLDVNRSELVLTQMETVPDYATESLGDRIESDKHTMERRNARQKEYRGKHIRSSLDEKNWIRKRETVEEVEIVRNKVKGISKVKINGRFPSDVFCIDRVTFKTENLTDTSEDSQNTTTSDAEDESQSNDWNYVVLLCPCQTSHTVCVRKCCPDSKLLHVADSEDRSARCVDHATHAQEEFDVEISISEQEPPQSLHTVPHYILHGTPHCRHGSYLLRNTSDRLSLKDSTTGSRDGWDRTSNRISFRVLHNSSVLLVGSRALVGTSQYCIDSIHYGASRRRIDGNILVCRLEEPHVDRTRRVIYSICFIVGTGFLMLTLVVYAVLPELRKSVHSWNIMAHIACSIVAYTAIVIANLYTIAFPTLCILMAYILQISFLSSQLWLNAMCIDIACTFSGLRAPSGCNLSTVDRRNFLYYSAYTWGTTALISGLTYVADSSALLAEDNALKPNFGVKACWFKDSASTAVFFYGPIGLLLVANLVLFHYTCWKIRATQKDTAITSAHRHVGGRTEDQTQFTTFIKLFLLMGVTWTFEIVSWVLGGPHYLWYLTDLLNVLRGVFIFIILCCKRNVLALMQKRILLGQRRIGVPGPRPRTESNTSHRTSKSSMTEFNTSHRTSKSSMSTEHVALSRLNLSSTTNLNTIHQGRILEEDSGEAFEPQLSVVQEVGEEREGKG